MMLNDGNYVALPNINGNDMSEPIYLAFLDSNGENIKNEKYSQNRDLLYEMPNQYDGPLETYGLYSNFHGTALYRDMFNDTIYNVLDKNRIVPYIVFNRGKYTPDIKDDNANKKKGKVYIKDVNETGKYLFLKYQYDKKIWSVILDKNTSKVISKNEIALIGKTSPFINYNYFFKYKISEDNSPFVGIVAYEKDKIYCIARAIDIERIDDYSNPVVMEVSLK